MPVIWRRSGFAPLRSKGYVVYTPLLFCLFTNKQGCANPKPAPYPGPSSRKRGARARSVRYYWPWAVGLRGGLGAKPMVQRFVHMGCEALSHNQLRRGGCLKPRTSFSWSSARSHGSLVFYTRRALGWANPSPGYVRRGCFTG